MRYGALLLFGAAVLGLLSGCSSSLREAAPKLPGAVAEPPDMGQPFIEFQVKSTRKSLTQVELSELSGWTLEPYRLEGSSAQSRAGVGPIDAPSGDTRTRVSRPICAAPCSVPVDGRAGQEYFFGGPDLRPSDHFKLSGERGRLVFTVRPGVESVWRAGAILATVGGAGTGVTSALLGLHALTGVLGDKDGAVVPAGILGGSAAVLGVGIVLVVAGSTTFAVERPVETGSLEPSLRFP
jgi:hypothetical protein